MSNDKYLADNGTAYLDKRTIVRCAQQAGRQAALKAKKAMGYAIVAEGRGIIKKYSDGTCEKLHRIGTWPRPVSDFPKR